MLRNAWSGLAVGCGCVAALVIFSIAFSVSAQDEPRYAGPSERGFLLPNGWTLKPAGHWIPLTDLPLNIVPLANGRHAMAATSGYNAHELVLVDLQEKAIVARQAVRQSWFGLAFEPRSGRLWWSGGGGDGLHTFDLSGQTLTRRGDPERIPVDTKDRARTKGNFRSGLAIDEARNVLYSLDIDAGSITTLDLASQNELKSAQAGDRPYDVVLSRNGSLLFVSDWAGRTVRVVEPTELRTVARIAVGENHNLI